MERPPTKEHWDWISWTSRRFVLESLAEVKSWNRKVTPTSIEWWNGVCVCVGMCIVWVCGGGSEARWEKNKLLWMEATNSQSTHDKGQSTPTSYTGYWNGQYRDVLIAAMLPPEINLSINTYTVSVSSVWKDIQTMFYTHLPLPSPCSWQVSRVEGNLIRDQNMTGLCLSEKHHLCPA